MAGLVENWVRDSEPAPPDPNSDDAYEAAARHARLVAKEADRLRVVEEARAQLRAEKITISNFDEQYLTRRQLEDLPAPDPLSKGVLPRHSYGILRGRDHSLKSFTAIDWACCLATGKRWQDHDVDQVRVLYIVGEGAYGISARIDAWEYGWRQLVADDMLVTRKTALNLHEPGPAFDHLLDRVQAGGFGLVVVDTLRRVSGAADGNGSEMGLVVDNLDRIKQATDNGTVLAIAHTDKGDHDTRGYSGIEDDADFVWAAKRDDDFLALQLTKMKDGPDGRTIHLMAQRTLRSLVLTGIDGPGQGNTTESQTKILDALRIMPDGGVTGPDLMDTAGFTKGQKPTYYRALKELITAGHIVFEQKARTKYYSLPGLLDDLTEPTTETGETDPPGDTHD
jgi:hypothetical protein